MKTMKCEEFEAKFAAFVAGALDAEQVEDMVRHQQTCSHCRHFNEESGKIRERFLDLSKLKVSPYFNANLQREINRLERGLEKPDFSPSSIPRFVAIATGFAVAIIAGFIVFQSNRPVTNPTAISPRTVAESQLETSPSNTADDYLLTEPTDVFYTMDEQIDTATHRLPEPAGTDSFPIPTEDDLWQLNQVSTTPGGN